MIFFFLYFKSEEISLTNISGTSICRPSGGYSSWIDYWKRTTGHVNKPDTCQILGCNNTGVVGGHVWKTRDVNNFYILPICNRCNHCRNTSTMWSKPSAIFARVTPEAAGSNPNCNFCQ